MNRPLLALWIVLLLGITPLARAQDSLPTTVLEISLVSPEGPQVLSSSRGVTEARRVFIDSAYLDTTPFPLWCCAAPSVKTEDGTHTATVTVAQHRTIGLLGYSLDHGLVEIVVTPEMMAGKERLAVELALPALSAPGTLDVEFTFDFDRSWADPEYLSLSGPITGCSIASRPVGKTVSSGNLVAAPGDYMVSLWPQNQCSAHCYTMEARVPAGVALQREVTLRSSESTALTHAFEYASGFAFRVNVVGRDCDVAHRLAALKKSLPGSVEALFSACGSDMPNVPDGWYTSAKLHSRVENSSWTDRQLTVGWSQSSLAFGSAVGPMGTTLRTLDRVPPGEYVIELSGPWIEDASFEIVVEDDPYWLSRQAPAVLLDVLPKKSVR